MKKFLQNRIAESGLTLPAVCVYAVGIWLLAGLLAGHWWWQLVCFAVTVYLMVELSNSNALLRVRSRMVASTFMVLTCTSPALLGSLQGGIVGLCFAAAASMLFRTYQDQRASGWVFYAFLCIGLASMAFVQTLLFVPLLWLLMATQLQSLTGRTWMASLIGLIAPYWLTLPWLLYQRDASPLTGHFAPLQHFPFPYDYSQLPAGMTCVFVFVVVLLLMGGLHFWNRSFEDKIRTRQLYGFFMAMAMGIITFACLQPQHANVLLHMLIICASPFAAHFLTLTHSKTTNVVFVATVCIAVLITALNLCEPYWGTLSGAITKLWNGLLIF